MKHSSECSGAPAGRRHFLKIGAAGLLGAGLAVSPFARALSAINSTPGNSTPENGAPGNGAPGNGRSFKKRLPPLSFSTLGCPDWTFPQTVDFAAANGYQGIEVRGILRQLDLPKCPEFSTPENIAATKKLMSSKGLRFVDLGSSAEMHHADPFARQKNLDDAKRFIDLAEALDCPYIRVFPNNLPKDQDRETTIGLIISALQELGNYAKNTRVTVLMESHGELIHSDDLKKIMDAVGNERVGLVWDIINMWSVTKEPPADVYKNLKKYIHHTHIKDLKVIDGKEHYTLLGQGETPIFGAIDLLEKEGYKGFYSFEWEKMWHPDIAASEVALADYPLAMKKHLGLLQTL